MGTLRKLGNNNTELHLNKGVIVLFSYGTPVAALIPAKGYLCTQYRYSPTTTRHISAWTDGSRDIIQVDQCVINDIVNGVEYV